MKTRQSGFGHIEIIVGVVVLALLGFIVFNFMNAQKKGDTAGSWKYTTFDDCIAHHSKPGEDPSKANDTCIALRDANKGSASDEKKVAPVEPQQQVGAKCSPEPALADAKGAFKELPFDLSNIRLVTLGKETNDARFVYPWVKSGKATIYAPADGVLYMIRHKVFESQGMKGNDYDMFFRVDCGTVYRFNHISDPRADIKAAYPAGDLPSGDYANGGTDMPERIKPKTAIKVKAGESLGATTGVPGSGSFDFAIGVAKEAPNPGEELAVCPFSVFNEPHKTTLMNMLGPKSGSPTPGYPCDIESRKF